MKRYTITNYFPRWIGARKREVSYDVWKFLLWREERVIYTTEINRSVFIVTRTNDYVAVYAIEKEG